MYEARLDVLVGVSEGAELFVVAHIALVSTELSFVLFDMVQPFYSIVGSRARFFLVTFVRILEFAQIWGVSPAFPALIDIGVVVRAVLVVVLALDVAFVSLEDLEVEMFDDPWLTTFLYDAFVFIK